MAGPGNIASLRNPRVKQAVKLRRRPYRDESGLMLIEGFREIARAVDNGHPLTELFVCEQLFLGKNEPELIERCRAAGCKEVLYCTPEVFHKIAYRDRPEGLLATAPRVRCGLPDVSLSDSPLVVVAQSIEKPGNLGTIVRSADAVGADCVIACDRCTDINNPNVVRASIGTLFSLPVVEAGTPEVISWLEANGLRILAATPHTDTVYTDVRLSGGIAVVVGTEQYGLGKEWMNRADWKVRIPMLGQGDSLHVATATAILLYEAVRQRSGQRATCAESGLARL
jgi:TrmH family RNA methyltransferase